jgi:hypothetical protein
MNLPLCVGVGECECWDIGQLGGQFVVV